METNIVEKIEQQRANETAGLSLGGLPRYPAHIMAEKQTAIDAAYTDALAGELEAARALAREADNVGLAAHSDPSSWLQPDELATATARAAFVKEDIAGLDADSLLNRMRQALASNDKPLQWLLLRYAPETLDSPSLHHELTQLRGQLTTAVIPEQTRQATAKAHQMRLEAEIRRVDAAAALHKARGSGNSFNPFAAEYR